MDKKTTRKTTTGRSTRSSRAKATQEAGVAVQEPPAKGKKAKRGPAPTHEQIAQRAQEIWEKRGRPQGQDREHWLEAEEQLKREMGA